MGIIDSNTQAYIRYTIQLLCQGLITLVQGESARLLSCPQDTYKGGSDHFHMSRLNFRDELTNSGKIHWPQ